MLHLIKIHDNITNVIWSISAYRILCLNNKCLKIYNTLKNFVAKHKYPIS